MYATAKIDKRQKVKVKTSAAIAGFLLITGSAAAFNEPDGLQMLNFGQAVRNILPKCEP